MAVTRLGDERRNRRCQHRGHSPEPSPVCLCGCSSAAQAVRRRWALGKEGREQWGTTTPVLVEAPKMATGGFQDLCVSLCCFRALLDTWSTWDEWGSSLDPALQRDEVCFPHSFLGHLGDQQGPGIVPAAGSSNLSTSAAVMSPPGNPSRTSPTCGSQAAETLQAGDIFKPAMG